MVQTIFKTIIRKEATRLIIENYQNKPMTLSWLDVVDNLELQGVSIRIGIENIPILYYKNEKYIVNDEHIKRLETCNVINFERVKV